MAIKEEANKFYKSFIRETSQNNFGDQINIVRLFPNYVSEEEVQFLEKACTKDEILEVLC